MIGGGLCEALKEEARRIGPSPSFWEQMTASILEGRVRGLDPREHIRNPRSLDDICQMLHEKIGATIKYKDAPDELKQFYLDIIKEVLRLLDYKV